MRNPITTALAITFTGFFAATPAVAECTRLAFTVNDYGKEGPTKDAMNLLDKHIATEMEKRGVTDYRVGEKDVSCELFLDLIVFDEHTCKAAANVCWGKDKRKALITAKKKSKTDKKKVAKKTKSKQKSATKTAAKPSTDKSKDSSSAAATVAKIDNAPRVGESAVRVTPNDTPKSTQAVTKKSKPQVVRTINVADEKSEKNAKPARGAVMSLATRASEDLDTRPESPTADALTAAPDAATAGILAARKRAELARQAAARAAARAAQEAANAERAAKDRAKAEAEQERAARAVAIAAREAARAAKAAAKAASEAAARAAEAAHAAASAENSSIATGSLSKKKTK